MKIKCENCGKKFNMEAEGGVCPKCGQINYIASESIVVNEKNIVTTSKKKAPFEIEKVKYSERSQIYKLITAVEIFVIIILLVVVSLYKANLKSKQEEDRIEEFQTRYHSYDDSGVARLEVNGGIVELSICDFPAEITLPEGYELITVSYKYDDKKGFDYNMTGALTEVYAVTKNDDFITTMSSEDMEAYMEDNVMDYSDLIQTSMYSEEGYLCFIVKKGQFEYIVLDTYSGDIENRVLEERITIVE